MRVRALSATGDMTFGQGQRNFYVNQKEGVAQKVKTRLGLYVGDWFLDITDGTPWRTQVFGFRTENLRDPALRARILGTQGVVSIGTYASQLTRSNRAFAVQVTLNTIYGQALVSTAVPSANGDVRFVR